MKVCFVSKHYPPYAGGLENRVRDLGGWLIGRGVGVVVLTSHEGGTRGREVVDGVEVRRSHPWLSLFNAPFLPGTLLGLLREDYDLIDVNLPDPFGGLCALAASVLRGKPLTVTYHADIVRGGLLHLPFKLLYRPFEWLLLSRASRVFVTSPDYAASSPSMRGFMGKVVVAPSFIDPSKYHPGVDGRPVRSRFPGRKIVLFVGRLVPYKGVDVLLEAASKVDAVFLIVGEGPMEAALRGKSHGLSNVAFEGRVGDDLLSSYYGGCDVLALPSVTRQEAFGLVLVEAMACGRPVVSSGFSGMPYVVGDAGLLVEPGDSKALSEALNRILSDPGLASELGGRGVCRVRELFTRDVVCEKIFSVYKSLVLRIKR